MPVLEWKRQFFLMKLKRLLAYVMRFAKNTQVKMECLRRDQSLLQSKKKESGGRLAVLVAEQNQQQ